MLSNPEPSDLPIHTFESAQDFERFLEREHSIAPGIYLKLAKKSSGRVSVSREEAVETALCFGWIDGRALAYDQHSWLVRYTPRRAKSVWSKKNVATVEALRTAGRMRPAGIAAVDAAQADGRWARAYDGPAAITVPEDLATALAQQPEAEAFFESLTRSDRYTVLASLQWVTPERRPTRLATVVQMLAEKRTSSRQGTTVDKRKAGADKGARRVRSRLSA
ncbi:hypothetical protein BDV25DRAFT_168812 [Aspergillus avenaceus]|uniref:Bacteriocin-protection, YdeI or OmpD-associated-domain-containing protein n=1 Tax=Aspergillus avenaceus TaxID=36643 RepID=A0A5N6TP33_ASPAV|nr:hypothetical protein BDV25DRAFT_168812 [Aspergillus avenaceus]